MPTIFSDGTYFLLSTIYGKIPSFPLVLIASTRGEVLELLCSGLNWGKYFNRQIICLVQGPGPELGTIHSLSKLPWDLW